MTVKNPFMANTTYKSEVTGTEYTFQKVAPRQWLRLKDDWKRKGETEESLIELLLENVVVNPKKTIDDFEDFAELDEVAKAAFRFQSGK